MSLPSIRHTKKDASETEEKKWAYQRLPTIDQQQHRHKSPKPTGISSKRRRNENDSNKSHNNSEDLFTMEITPIAGISPYKAINKHSQKKSSNTVDIFDAKGSVAGLLKSVRELTIGGKRTKKARKNHKKTRKNRRHSVKK